MTTVTAEPIVTHPDDDDDEKENADEKEDEHNNNQQQHEPANNDNDNDNDNARLEPNKTTQGVITNAGEIQAQNQLILTYCERSMDVVSLMGEVFTATEDGQQVMAIAEAIQTNAISIVSTLANMRECIQLVMALQKYKPANTQTGTAAHEKIWEGIIDGSCLMIEFSLKISQNTAKFWGFLVSLYGDLRMFCALHRTAYDMGKTVSLTSSLRPLDQTLDDFEQFASTFQLQIETFTRSTLDSIKQTMLSSVGEETIGPAVSQLAEAGQLRQLKIADLKRIYVQYRESHMPKIMELRYKVADCEGARAGAAAMIGFLNGNIKTLAEARARAEQQHSNYMSQAANTSNFRTQTTTSYSYKTSGWWLWKKRTRVAHTSTTQVKTGAQDALLSQAATWARLAEAKRRTQKQEQKEQSQATAVVEKMRSSIEAHRMKLTVLEKEVKHAFGTAEADVNLADKQWEKRRKALEDIEDTTGFTDPKTMKEFVHLGLELRNVSMAALQDTGTLRENLGLFYDQLRKQCRCEITITSYFKDKLPKTFAQAFLQSPNELALVKDLECVKEEYFDASIWPIVQNLKPTANHRAILLDICYRKTSEWKQEQQSLQEITVVRLLRETPILAFFLQECSQRLNFAAKALKFVSVDRAAVSPIYLKMTAFGEQAFPEIIMPAMKAIKPRKHGSQKMLKHKVSESSSADYIQLLSDWRLERSIKKFKNMDLTDVEQWNSFGKQELKQLFSNKAERKIFERKLSEYNNANAGSAAVGFRSLLTTWGLGQFGDAFEEQGFVDVEDWKVLEAEDFGGLFNNAQQAQRRRFEMKVRFHFMQTSDDNSVSGSNSDSDPDPDSDSAPADFRALLKDWRLKQYADRFAKKKCTNVSKWPKLSDAQLQAIFQRKEKYIARFQAALREYNDMSTDSESIIASSSSSSSPTPPPPKPKSYRDLLTDWRLEKFVPEFKSKKKTNVTKWKKLAKDKRQLNALFDGEERYVRRFKDALRKYEAEQSKHSDSDSDSGSDASDRNNNNSNRRRTRRKHQQKKTHTRENRSSDSGGSNGGRKNKNNSRSKPRKRRTHTAVSDHGISDPESGDAKNAEPADANSESDSNQESGDGVLKDLVTNRQYLYKSQTGGIMTCYTLDMHKKMKLKYTASDEVMRKVKKKIKRGKRDGNDVYILFDEKHFQHKTKGKVIKYTVTGAQIVLRSSSESSDSQ